LDGAREPRRIKDLREVAAIMLTNSALALPKESRERRIELLKLQVERLPETAATTESCLALGLEYYDLKDYDNMLKYLEMGTKQDKTDWILTMTYSSSYRQECFRLIIQYYENDKKDYESALKWYKAWKPLCGCGTCMQGMLDTREEKIIELTKKLKLPLEEAYLGLLRDGTISRNALVSLILSFETSGSLAKLREYAETILKDTPENESAKILMRYFGFCVLADSGDIETLFETAQKWADEQRGRYNDVSLVALMALGRTGDKGLEFLRGKVSKN
jgi:hypothetical protein